MKIYKLLVGPFFVTGMLCAYHFYSGQFKLKNIQFERPIRGENAASFYSQEDLSLLQAIFSQPFTYLDRGKQSYVFLSQDGNYVLKFFDAKALQPNPFLASSLENESLKRKQQRLFEGYRLAYMKEREHSGLLFVHFPGETEILRPVLVRDRFGFTHQVPLDQVPFVIQMKATPTRTVISLLLQRGDLAMVKVRLRQILDLYIEGYKRGIYDDDHNFMYNTGFIGDRPIRMDLGRLQEDKAYMQKEVYMKDLQKIALERVGGWMRRHFPHYQAEIVADMRAKLELQERIN